MRLRIRTRAREANRSRLVLLACAGPVLLAAIALAEPVRSEGRPAELVADLSDGPLKARLERCLDQPARRSAFSIGHRGAPLRFPEHTRESYTAAAAQGAGIIECDATFARDRTLVCRHDPCDLHSTTNILETPLAARCAEPFQPADRAKGRAASARCCTNDLTLDELRTLCARMDRVDPAATTVQAYLAPGMPAAMLNGAQCAKLMTHAESIDLISELGPGMTPELKSPAVPMPFDGDYTIERYASALLEDYRAAGVQPERVWPQSFDLNVVRYWLARHPEFAPRVIWLDGRYESAGFDPADPATWSPRMAELRAMGVRYLAPPIPVLISVEDGAIVPTAYARAARAAGLELITWTLERPGTLAGAEGFYFSSVSSVLSREGDVYRVLDALAKDVGVAGVFSDWPATTTFYANCAGI